MKQKIKKTVKKVAEKVNLIRPRCTMVYIVKDREEFYRVVRNMRYERFVSFGFLWLILDQSGDDFKDIPAAEKMDYEYLTNILSRKEVIVVPTDPDLTTGDCYNKAISMVNSELICFAHSGISYDFDVAAMVYKAARKFRKAGSYSVTFEDVLYQKSEEKRQGIFLKPINDYKIIRMVLPVYFLRVSAIGNLRFDNVCEQESDTIFLLKFLNQNQETVKINGVAGKYDKRFMNRRRKKYQGCGDRHFYMDSLRENYLPMLKAYGKGNVPLWLIKCIYYNMHFKYTANTNFGDNGLVDKEHLPEFVQLTKEILEYVPDELIMTFDRGEQYVPELSLRNLFEYIKYDGDLEKLDRKFYIEDEKLYYSQCGVVYDMEEYRNFHIMAFHKKGEKLYIYIRYNAKQLMEYAPDCIDIRLNGKPCRIIENGIYALEKVFGETYDKSFSFQLEIPFEELYAKDRSRLEFYVTLNGKTIPMAFLFKRIPSKLNTDILSSYWMVDPEHMMTFSKNSLIFQKVTEEEKAIQESRYVEEIATFLSQNPFRRLDLLYRYQEKENNELLKNVISVRKNYLKEKKNNPDRRIWVYFDKLYKAGDNGEYQFRHDMKIAKEQGIECYYYVNEDAPDYERLIGEFPDNIIVYGSAKGRLYGLLAENVVATHPDMIEFLGFAKKEAMYVKDLFQGNLICIAHGVTIQKNAEVQNRLFDNTMFYTTSSKYEVAHIKHPVYGYEDDEVALTGMARFDGLVNRDKKQILITPTWRKSLVGEAERNTGRSYVNSFKSTDYYKIYNGLINDPRIIESAKKNGYKLIFLLHPQMSAQINDYDRNDYVELVPASGDMSYEKILCESSLMITDYSGIHYDFGYMRKPVIYYQPKEIPMRFEEGGMKFATMGFGPVCTEYEEAVRLICEYMDHQCVMPEEFKKHADDFFAFDDHNNCDRIFKAIMEWTESRK